MIKVNLEKCIIKEKTVVLLAEIAMALDTIIDGLSTAKGTSYNKELDKVIFLDLQFNEKGERQ